MSSSSVTNPSYIIALGKLAAFAYELVYVILPPARSIFLPDVVTTPTPSGTMATSPPDSLTICLPFTFKLPPSSGVKSSCTDVNPGASSTKINAVPFELTLITLFASAGDIDIGVSDRSANVLAPLPLLPLTVFVIITLSVTASVAKLIPVPATRVTVSPVDSASTVVCPDTAILANALPPAPPPP